MHSLNHTLSNGMLCESHISGKKNNNRRPIRSAGEEIKVLVAQSYLTLCDPMDCSPPGSSVHGISQARILEWVAISFSGDLPDSGIKPQSPALQAVSLPCELPGKHKGKLTFNLFAFGWSDGLLGLEPGISC